MEQFREQKNQEETKTEKAYKGAKFMILTVFRVYKIGKERIEYLKSNIEGLDLIKNINLEKINHDLEGCADIESKEEFIESIFNILKPIIDLKIKNPDFFTSGKEEPEYISINEILSYQLYDDSIDIHILPEEKPEKMMSDFKNGLEKLANVVNKNEKIKTIEAISWIVALHPKIVEKFGFILDDEPQPGDVGKIYRASMSRENFLARYLY